MSKIISFSGTLGAGKDTAADVCCEIAASMGLAAEKFSFAAEVYREIARAFSVTVARLQVRETKETPVPWLTLSACENKDYPEVALKTISAWRVRDGLEPIGMDTPLSPREVLRSWGTEFRRESRFGHVNYWVDFVDQQMHESPDIDLWLCSDARLDNEHGLLAQRDACFVRINATHLPENDADFETLHASDSKWRKWDFDQVILYDFADRDQFRADLEAICNEKLCDKPSLSV